MILSFLLILFTMSCVLVWHKVRIGRQTYIHEQNMQLLHQKFIEENSNNVKSSEQIQLSDEALKSIRQSNTVIGRDVYLAFRDILDQLTNHGTVD